jgi:sugar phosphate isomerase/epimerase
MCTGEMSGIGGFSLNHIDKEKKKSAVEAFKVAIKLAAFFEVNINVGRIRGTIGEDGEKKSLIRLGESLQEINQYITSESLRTRILIEPLRKDICPILNNCKETGGFISEYSLQNFGILLDSDHMDYEIDKQFIRSCPEMIQHIHLADSFHVPLGKGNIDFKRFFDLLQSAGYRWNYSVEVFCQDNPFGVVSDTVTYLRRYSIFREVLT